jgi:hypothetical protein
MNIGDDVGNSKARWVRVSVELLNHTALDHGPFDRRSAWLWLITNAAVRDKMVNHKGQPFALKRGQVLAGRAYLATAWNWSEKQVRVFLELLASENMVEKGQSNGHFANVLTISNYAKYQDVPQEKDQKKGQSGASAGPVQGQTSTLDTSYTNNTPLPPKGGPTPGDAIKAFHAYNDTALRCGLQQAKSLTPDRQRRLIARLRDYGLDGWSVALANVERSSFLTGKNDNGWRADFDFLLQAKSFNKVHDGSYGNGRHTAQTATVIPLASRDPNRFEDEAYLLKIAKELGVPVNV